MSEQIYIDWIETQTEILNKGTHKKVHILIALSENKRFAWVELIRDTQPLTILFATLRIFQVFINIYEMKIKTIVTDTKESFYAPEKRNLHAFERLLKEFRIKHITQNHIDIKMRRFESLFYNRLMQQAPYPDKTSLEAYLFEFISAYNHPEMVLETQSDLSEKEEIQKLPNELGDSSEVSEKPNSSEVNRWQNHSATNPSLKHEEDGVRIYINEDVNVLNDFCAERDISFEETMSFSEAMVALGSQTVCVDNSTGFNTGRDINACEANMQNSVPKQKAKNEKRRKRKLIFANKTVPTKTILKRKNSLMPKRATNRKKEQEVKLIF